MKFTDSYLTSIHPVCCQVWQHRKAHWGSLYLLPSRHRHGLVKHYIMTYGWCSEHWTDKSSFDLANYVVLSLTQCTSVEKRTSLLCLARFIDRPHQEKPGSPKQCLHSCQAAMHTQTLAYITVRHWRSADINTPKQKLKVYVTPSVRTQATSFHTIPTFKAYWKNKVNEAFLTVICVAWPVCACVCILYVAGVERDALYGLTAEASGTPVITNSSVLIR